MRGAPRKDQKYYFKLIIVKMLGLYGPLPGDPQAGLNAHSNVFYIFTLNIDQQ